MKLKKKKKLYLLHSIVDFYLVSLNVVHFPIPMSGTSHNVIRFDTNFLVKKTKQKTKTNKKKEKKVINHPTSFSGKY